MLQKHSKHTLDIDLSKLEFLNVFDYQTYRKIHALHYLLIS